MIVVKYNGGIGNQLFQSLLQAILLYSLCRHRRVQAQDDTWRFSAGNIDSNLDD